MNPHFLVFGEANANLIDGSTIWLQSLALIVRGLGNVRVTVLLRHARVSDVITLPIEEAGATLATVGEVMGEPIEAAEAEQCVEAMRILHHRHGFAAMFVRGNDTLLALAQDADLHKIVWAYWLRRPNVVDPASDTATLLVAAQFPRLLVQSDWHKAVLETAYGFDARRIVVVPPTIPPEVFESVAEQDRDFASVYSGKLDKEYNVEGFTQIPALTRLHGVPTRILFLGDKFNRATGDPAFQGRMRKTLTESSGVEWLGGMPRHEALRNMKRASFGLCTRQASYDSSLEISTKLLEFCALGVPPILNRTELHERFLGRDYPYFAASVTDIVEHLVRHAGDPSTHTASITHVRARALLFSREVAVQRLRKALTSAGLLQSNLTPQVGRKLARLVVAGHDLKFLAEALPLLEASKRFDIRIDRWRASRRHDVENSRALLDWADAVFCEWCAGAAVWYSRNARADQRVVVRLHRFEAFEPDPHQVDFTKVHRLIVVSDYFRDLCASEFKAPGERIRVLPQYVNFDEFHRPKQRWADFTLGMVGMNGFFHKRFDRAVDLLRELRRDDPRWRLRIRSVMPWDIDWVWRREAEVERFLSTFAAIAGFDDLRDNIIFDRPGPDMAEWFRHVSFILSPSESEGCHTAVAEGMASGAFPILINWPGAASVYPAEYISDTVEGMAKTVFSLAERHRKHEEREKIADLARPFDVALTAERFIGYLLGDE